MRYEVINERTPEEYTTILTAKIRWWHSFLSGKEVIKEFLCLSHDKTKSTHLEVYEVIPQTGDTPLFKRLTKKEESRLWKFVDRYRDERKKRERESHAHKIMRERESKVAKEYGDYFKEPIGGPQNYRD